MRGSYFAMAGLSTWVAFGPSAAANFMIDDFSSGTVAITNATGVLQELREGGLANTLGGWRRAQVRNYAGASAVENTPSSLTITAGVLAVVRGGFGTGDFRLEYTGEEFPGASNWNSTALEPIEALRFTFTENSNKALRVTVRAARWDGGFAGFTQSAVVSAYVPVGPGVVDVPLAGLDLQAFGPIDWLEVVFSYEPVPYVYDDVVFESFSIDSIEAVIAEPTALGFLSLGGLAVLRRRSGGHRLACRKRPGVGVGICAVGCRVCTRPAARRGRTRERAVLRCQRASAR